MNMRSWVRSYGLPLKCSQWASYADDKDEEVRLFKLGYGQGQKFVEAAWSSKFDMDQEETAPTAKLTGKSIEVSLILAFCRQHPRSTIYQETADTYGAMRSLRTPLSSGGARAPTEKQQGKQDTSRF